MWNPYDSIPAASSLYDLTVSQDIFCAGHSTLADGRLLLAGGTDADGVGIDASYIYDPVSRAWTKQPDMAAFRFYPTNTTLGDGRVLVTAGTEYQQMITFGGTDGTRLHNDLDRVFALLEVPRETQEIRVDATCQGPPGVRIGHSAVFDQIYDNPYTLQRQIIVYGGRDTTGGLNKTYGDVWRLVRDDSLRTWCWTELHPTGTAPPPRSRHSAIMSLYPGGDESMIVFGGVDSLGTPLNDIWKLHLHPPSNIRWEQLTPASAPPARYGHTAVYDYRHKRMFIFGGRDNGMPNPFRQDRLWMLDFMAPSLQWKAIGRSSVPSPREGHVAIVADPDSDWVRYRMYIFGGQDKDSLQDDVWALWLAADTSAVAWKRITTFPDNTAGNPLARTRHGAIWDPIHQRMVTYAGKSASSIVGDLWALGPTTANDSLQWTRLAPDSAAKARVGPTAMLHQVIFHARWPERFDPTQSSAPWNLYGPSASLNQPTYPLTFLLPNGKILYAGPDANTRTLTDTTWNATPIVSRTLGGSGVTYRPGFIFKCGAVADHDGVAGTDSSEYIDMTAPTPAWQFGGRMYKPRNEPNAVALPTGDVLVLGGVEVWSDPTKPVRGPQIWSATTHTFSDTLANDPAVRDYHSTALLLPDGRILSAGGNNNHPPYMLEDQIHEAAIFWPPYLFDAQGHLATTTRPVINGVNTSIGYRQVFLLCTPSASDIRSVCLIRPGAVTHAFDENQRYVPLDFTYCGEGSMLRISAPADSNIAPAGDYMLFIARADSIPSIATWVRLGIATGGSPYCATCSHACPFVDVQADSGWTAENTILGRSLTGTFLDDACPVTHSLVSTKGEYALRLRENEQETTTLDAVQLQIVDHTPSVSAFALDDSIVLGVATPAFRVTTIAGEDVTEWVTGTGTFTGAAGDTLLVEMTHGDHGASPRHGEIQDAPSSLLLGASGKPDPEGGNAPRVGEGGGRPRPTDEAVLDGTGILVEIPDEKTGWREIAHLYPRENSSDFVVDSVGTGPIRLIFLAQHDLSFVGHLTKSNATSIVQTLSATSAFHSRLGDAGFALTKAEDSLTVQIAPGDTVSLRFPAPPLADTLVREAFLLSHGVYTSKEQPPQLSLPRMGAGESIPPWFALEQNRPNPFTRVTHIRFDLRRKAPVTLDVFDAQGRRVRRVSHRLYAAGRWTVDWNGRDDQGRRLPAGVYVYVLEAGDVHAQRRLVLF
jgi:hypothetical protein